MIDRKIAPRANLDQLKKQAKDLVKARRAGSPSAALRIQAFHPSPPTLGNHFALHDAQLVVAREFGFASWPKVVEAFDAAQPGEANAVDLAGLANACVWHRPEKHRLARDLVSRGAECNIWTAARAGLLEKVQSLLTTNPQLLNSTDDRGRTALYRAACVYGKFEEGEAVADFMIGHGAKIDIFTAATLTLFDEARAILQEEPNAARAVDPEGMSTLHWAMRSRRNGSRAVGLTKLLLEHGADPRAKNPQEEGMQPLHHAAEWPARAAQIDLLLAHGADLEAKSDTGMTPLDYAVDRGRKGAVRNLIDRGAKASKG